MPVRQKQAKGPRDPTGSAAAVVAATENCEGRVLDTSGSAAELMDVGVRE